MKNHSESSQEAASVYEFNIVILAQLARWYGQIAENAPIKNFASDDANRSIYWDGKIYATSLGRRRGQIGIRITVKAQDSQKTLDDWWLPVDALDRVRIELPLEDYADL